MQGVRVVRIDGALCGTGKEENNNHPLLPLLSPVTPLFQCALPYV